MATLKHLLQQAVEYTRTNWDGGLDGEELRSLLDVGPFRSKTKTRNDHLANSLNRDDNVSYSRARDVPLTGDEPVFGDFLLLEYCGHYPFAVLCDFDDEIQLENAILSPYGFISPFTTYMVAFKHYALRPYRLSFLNADGVRVAFDKRRQYEAPVYSESEVFAERELDWIAT